MGTQQLFIPGKVKVGYQKRSDTYTGQLAYVIYYDQKGKLRKETSWEGWRDKKIKAEEFDNEPTEGFVLNKGVGGARQSYGWNARNEYIRVYDPRNFEFEISVANLLFILRECDCNKGKGLEGKFVYAWDGTELVLLPATSEDFKVSNNFTQLQSQKVLAKELVAGATYTTKKQEQLVYLGKFDYFYLKDKDKTEYDGSKTTECVKKFVFFKAGQKDKSEQLVILNDIKNIAALISDVVHPDFAKMVEKYYKSEHGSKIVSLELRSQKKVKNDYGYSHTWYYKDETKLLNDEFVECQTNYSNRWNGKKYDKKLEYVYVGKRLFIQDGNLVVEKSDRVASTPNNVLHEDLKRSRYSYYSNNEKDYTLVPWVEPTNKELFVVLESGAKYKWCSYTFSKKS